MKKIIFISLLVFSFIAKAQTISIQPSFPKAGDSVFVFTDFSFSMLPLKANQTTVIDTFNKTIYLERCYQITNLTEPRQLLDTFTLGVLPIGLYYVTLVKTDSRGPRCGAIIGRDTFATTIQVLPLTNGIHTIGEEDFVVNNPIEKNIVVQLKNVSSGKMQLVDINGRIAKEMVFDNVAIIQCMADDIACGIYVLILQTDNGILRKKVVKY